MITAFAAAGILFATASPGGAAAAGSGAGTGWEYATAGGDCAPDMGEPLGAEVVDETFELSHYGTYASAVPPVGLPAVYVGPSDVSIEVADNVAGPVAAYSGDCDGPTSFPIPGQIAITSVQISGSGDLGGQVSCGLKDETTGTYVRVNNIAVFTFTATCSITGNSGLGSATIDVNHVIQGTMNPCILVPPAGFPANPECAVIEDPAGGEAGSHLVTTYEAVGV